MAYRNEQQGSAQYATRRFTISCLGWGGRSCLLGLLGAFALLVLGMTSSPQAAPFAYISNFNGAVSVIDTATNTVTAMVPMGGTHGVAVHPNGTQVYVASFSISTVSVIDTAINTVTATVPVSLPNNVGMHPNGTRVYVAGSSAVSVIDTATNTVTATVPGLASGLAVHPNGTRVYAAAPTDGRVRVIDTATNTVIATVSLSPPTRGSYYHGVAVHPNGTRVYVADGGATDTVYVIDTVGNAVVATVGMPTPVGAAVHPNGTRVYVANHQSNTVSVIGTATNTVVATVPVGNGPWGVAVHPNGTRVYVANWGSGSVSVIDTATDTVTGTVSVGGNPMAVGQFIGLGLPAGPVCDIQLNKATFVNGDQVIAQVARLANPGQNPVPVEVKLWFELPGSPPPVPFLTVGADGSFVLSPGFNRDFGPLPLATVQPTYPRGPYSFNCRLLHAVTGAPLAEDFNPFQLQ